MISFEQLVFVALPAIMLIASGAAASARAPKPWLRSGVLHLAAGVVFSVVAVELIPDLLRDHRPIETVLGFALGVAAMLALRSFTERAEKSAGESERKVVSKVAKEEQLPLGMLAGVAIDLLVDGFMIGIGFAAGAKEGRLLALALSVELVSLGLALAVSIAELSIRRSLMLKVLTSMSGVFVVGAVVGMTLLARLSSHVLAGVLAFGSAALLFLVTEELLTEAHEEKESPALTAMFFVGFLFFLILGMVS